MMSTPSNRSRWHQKFRVAATGLFEVVRMHNSFHVHGVMAILVIAAATASHAQPWHWCVLILSIGGVLTAELFNTAIEELVRVLHPDTDPRIGRVLDIAAAAVLVASITAAIVGLVIGYTLC